MIYVFEVDLMAWLLWAAGEILRADDVFAPSHDTAIRAISSRLEVLRRRFRHGCKEELLPLVSIGDVGRAFEADTSGRWASGQLRMSDR